MAMAERKPNGRKGAENVLADLGIDVAGGLSASTLLAMTVNHLIDRRGLSLAAASKLLGVSQPTVAAIRNYKLQRISLERLLRALTSLGQHVEISVTAGTKRKPARIDVASC